jgi:hypothetical protein
VSDRAILDTGPLVAFLDADFRVYRRDGGAEIAVVAP